MKNGNVVGRRLGITEQDKEHFALQLRLAKMQHNETLAREKLEREFDCYGGGKDDGFELYVTEQAEAKAEELDEDK